MKWQVLLLAAAAMPAAHAQTNPPAVYPASALDLHHTIQPGDSLYRLAGQYLASAAQWPVLRDSNTLRNPHLLQPGQVLRIPAAALPAQPVAAAVTFIPVSYTHLDVYKRQARYRRPATRLVMSRERGRCTPHLIQDMVAQVALGPKAEPVSYTHLDVYKRQP